MTVAELVEELARAAAAEEVTIQVNHYALGGKILRQTEHLSTIERVDRQAGRVKIIVKGTW